MGAARSSEETREVCRFCGLCLSTATSHQELCENLRHNGLLSNDELLTAFLQVDRGRFVPEGAEDYAYVDAAVPLGAGSQISAPHVHASALKMLWERMSELQQEQAGSGRRLHVLDIGAGSGYMSLLLATLVRSMPSLWDVLAVEHMPELAEAGRANIVRTSPTVLAPDGVLTFQCGDALDMVNSPQHKRSYDIVHCGAALADKPPDWLAILLRPGGRAVAPIGPTDSPQWLSTIDKAEDESITIEHRLRVLYVPVTTEAKQRDRHDHWDEVVERCQRNSAAVLGT
mmetsp:Transcript_58745/g.108406  ORF Transcript_58745/g.108406 Transcript_58745/m.108406 type:complete len:286 (+) Transcript_58745:80-937(+)